MNLHLLYYQFTQLCINKKRTLYRSVLSCDSRGIQTHNLLIRSQMLYSVELGSLAFVLRLQRYDYFLEPPNFFLIFFKKSSFLAIFHDILFIYPAFL